MKFVLLVVPILRLVTAQIDIGLKDVCVVYTVIAHPDLISSCYSSGAVATIGQVTTAFSSATCLNTIITRLETINKPTSTDVIEYTTFTTDIYTTVCPSPTIFTYGRQTYTVAEATTITITDCPCTYSRPKSTFSTPSSTTDVALGTVTSSYDPKIASSLYDPGSSTSSSGTVPFSSSSSAYITVRSFENHLATSPEAPSSLSVHTPRSGVSGLFSTTTSSNAQFSSIFAVFSTVSTAVSSNTLLSLASTLSFGGFPSVPTGASSNAPSSPIYPSSSVLSTSHSTAVSLDTASSLVYTSPSGISSSLSTAALENTPSFSVHILSSAASGASVNGSPSNPPSSSAIHNSNPGISGTLSTATSSNTTSVPVPTSRFAVSSTSSKAVLSSTPSSSVAADSSSAAYGSSTTEASSVTSSSTLVQTSSSSTSDSSSASPFNTHSSSFIHTSSYAVSDSSPIAVPTRAESSARIYTSISAVSSSLSTPASSSPPSSKISTTSYILSFSGTPSPTLSTQTPPSSTGCQPSAPTYTRPGTAFDCCQYHVVVTGDGCEAIETRYGITFAEFRALNQDLDAFCDNLDLGLAYCVQGVPNNITSSSAFASSTVMDGISSSTFIASTSSTTTVLSTTNNAVTSTLVPSQPPASSSEACLFPLPSGSIPPTIGSATLASNPSPAVYNYTDTIFNFGMLDTPIGELAFAELNPTSLANDSFAFYQISTAVLPPTIGCSAFGYIYHVDTGLCLTTNQTSSTYPRYENGDMSLEPCNTCAGIPPTNQTFCTDEYSIGVFDPYQCILFFGDTTDANSFYAPTYGGGPGVTNADLSKVIIDGGDCIFLLFPEF